MSWVKTLTRFEVVSWSKSRVTKFLESGAALGTLNEFPYLTLPAQLAQDPVRKLTYVGLKI